MDADSLTVERCEHEARRGGRQGGDGARVGIAVAFVVVAHLALKLPGCGRADLWLDEAVSVHFAQLDPYRLVAAVRQDTNPPLYYLLLSSWERLFGSSEAAMRWPSALASALTGGVLFLVARRVGGRFVAWCSTAIFFASAANLYFAHQARPYALATLFSCLAFGVFLRLLEQPTWPRALAVAALNALACSSHYLTALAVPAQLLAFLLPWRGWAGLRRFALAHALIGSLVGVNSVPWLLRQVSVELQRIAGPHGPGPGAHEVLGLLGWYAGRIEITSTGRPYHSPAHGTARVQLTPTRPHLRRAGARRARLAGRAPRQGASCLVRRAASRSARGSPLVRPPVAIEAPNALTSRCPVAEAGHRSARGTICLLSATPRCGWPPSCRRTPPGTPHGPGRLPGGRPATPAARR